MKLLVLMAVLLAVSADPMFRAADEASEEALNVEASDEGTSPSRDDIIKIIYENVLKQLATSNANPIQRPNNPLNEPEETAEQPTKNRPSYHLVPASIYKPMYTTPQFSPYSRYPSFGGPYSPSFYSPYSSYGPYGSFQPFSPYGYPFYMRQRPLYAAPYSPSMYNPSMYSPSMYGPSSKFQAAYYHPVTGMPYQRLPVAVVRPYKQRPYPVIVPPVDQRPYDDNMSDQEAMSYLEAQKAQQQFKPQRIFPSLSQSYSPNYRQPELIENAYSLAKMSEMYAQMAQALSAVAAGKRDNIYMTA